VQFWTTVYLRTASKIVTGKHESGITSLENSPPANILESGPLGQLGERSPLPGCEHESKSERPPAFEKE
jgi:hypothetical protein